jgi:hypothetical protein
MQDFGLSTRRPVVQHARTKCAITSLLFAKVRLSCLIKAGWQHQHDALPSKYAVAMMGASIHVCHTYTAVDTYLPSLLLLLLLQDAPVVVAASDAGGLMVFRLVNVAADRFEPPELQQTRLEEALRANVMKAALSGAG